MANFFDQFRSQKEVLSSLWPGSEQQVKAVFSKRKTLLGLLFLLFISASVLGFSFFSRQQNISQGVPAKKLADIDPQDTTPGKQENLPDLEKENVSAEKYQSENFQISHISFGGDAALAVGDAENLPIEIFAVKTEAFLNEKDNESKIAVSWKSNKLTASEVTYALSGGGGSEMAKEDDFGFSHSVILPALEPGSAYVFSIKSADRWGNSRSFGYYGAYSSAKADSIFELIGKTFGETFGWAINR